MATVEECRKALDQLTTRLVDVEPALRAKHVPERTVSCHLSDLGVSFVGRLDQHGLHELAEVDDQDSDTDVRLTMSSDELIALAEQQEDFLSGWLRGRIQVSASMRDLLRLRSLLGL
jgi:predicted lipid carrier protein YhbT